MMKSVRGILVAILALYAMVGQSQDNLSFTYVEDNPSQSAIATIFQDQHGFIWFGTRYGLHKYDGRNFTVYLANPNDSTAISNSRISKAMMDRNGDIWVAGSGVNFFDYSEGTFSWIQHDPNDPNSIPSNSTTFIFEDREGYLWVGTDDAGLARIDRDTKDVMRYQHNQADPFSISSNFVTSILEDRSGNLWVGTYGGGINLLDRKNQRFIRYSESDDSGLANDIIRTIYQGSGSVWVGTREGLNEIKYHRDGRFTFEPLALVGQSGMTREIEESIVMSILEDKKGNLWVGSEENGLYMINSQRNSVKHFLSNDEGIYNKSIWSLYEDNSGIIWVGTFANGLSKIDPYHPKLKHVRVQPGNQNSLSYNVTSSFAQSQDGTLWVGTDGGGVNRFDNDGSNTVFKNRNGNPGTLTSNAVVGLHMDSDENLWIATWNGGLSQMRKGSDQMINYPVVEKGTPDALRGNEVFDIEEDSRGNLWLAVFRHGVDILNRETGKFIHLGPTQDKKHQLSAIKTKMIASTKPNEFFIGYEGNGLDHVIVNEDYEIVSLKNYRHIPNDTSSLSHDFITDILVDSKERVWVATHGEGINLMVESGKFRRISMEDGLPSNLIVSLVEDQSGNVWVGTSAGLARLDEDFNIRILDESDGLQGSEFFTKAAYVNSDGELFFGGLKGFNQFRAEDVIQNMNIPEVHITGFDVQGFPEKSVRKGVLVRDHFLDGKIELSHEENDFSFNFSVLNYSQSYKNKYAYKLENYDENWIQAEDGQNVSYTNVPPGQYTFKVKGANNDGIWNVHGESILISIAHPWYASSIAFTIYALLLAALLLWARETIINRERLKNELKLEHIELTKMQEINDLKSRFFANISHEFRTPLTLILGPLKSLINNTYKGDPKNQYRIMARNADRLLRLINQILELSKLESGTMKLQTTKGDIVKFLKPLAHSFTSYAEKQFIDYKCEFPEEGVEMYFEKDKIEKVVINIISNAFKYTPEFGKIKFNVKVKSDTISFSVEDSGVGIPSDQIKYIFNRFYQVENNQQKGTGIGLALTKELVDLHKGEIKVKSQEKKGSTFTVVLKRGNSHLLEDEILSSGKEAPQAAEDFNIPEEELAATTAPDISTIQESNESNLEELPIILVAEDNEDMRLFISEYLVTNYQIIEADNGKKALQLANEQIPDVIISDIMMPEMDGYELTEKIRADERTSHIPIILLTAKASGESTEKGFELGADYYVTKPFNPKLLELRIKNILRSRDHVRTQLIADKDQNIEPKELKIASKDQEFLKKAIACVEENLSNSNFGVDDICRELGMSRTQLYRKLKGLVGQSANEFVRSFRLKRAAQLLRQQEMTISEVTYQVGFNDLQYFRYCFKNQFGVNPSEYAQSLQ